MRARFHTEPKLAPIGRETDRSEKRKLRPPAFNPARAPASGRVPLERVRVQATSGRRLIRIQ